MDRRVPMGVILAPILEGKVEAWQNCTREFQRTRSKEFKEFNSRYGPNKPLMDRRCSSVPRRGQVSV